MTESRDPHRPDNLLPIHRQSTEAPQAGREHPCFGAEDEVEKVRSKGGEEEEEVKRDGEN